MLHWHHVEIVSVYDNLDGFVAWVNESGDSRCHRETPSSFPVTGCLT